MRTNDESPVDILIDEVRQRRRDLLAACGDDLDALIRLIRQREAEHPGRVKDPRLTSPGAHRDPRRAQILE